MSYISTSQACRLLGVSPEFIFRRIEFGQLHPYSKDGSPWVPRKRMYFERAAIEAFQEAPPPEDGRVWLSVEETMERLGIAKGSAFRLGAQGKILARRLHGMTCNGRKSFEFEEQSVLAYRERVYNQPRTPEEAEEWMPIREAMKRLGMTRHGVKERMHAGLLEARHFGPPEKQALFFRRSQVEAQALAHPGYKPRHKPLPATADEAKCARFAGFFNGEGCVQIRNESRRHSAYWWIEITLPNTYFEELYWIKEHFGGSVCHRRPKEERRKEIKVWRSSGAKAVEILKSLLPHLCAKKRQAELAIAFQEHLDEHRYGRWDAMPSEVIEWRQQQKAQMSALNRRGPSP